ncbi:hypothetical protein JYT21_00310 [bacterium AH-315-B15]|nr:hypothetical protein [bacterium AH-315-B15]
MNPKIYSFLLAILRVLNGNSQEQFNLILNNGTTTYSAYDSKICGDTLLCVGRGSGEVFYALDLNTMETLWYTETSSSFSQGLYCIDSRDTLIVIGGSNSAPDGVAKAKVHAF